MKHTTILSFVLTLIAATDVVSPAQRASAADAESGTSPVARASKIIYKGESSVQAQRVLFVFVRFRDDTTDTDGCTQSAVQWRKPDQMPALADYALATEPVPPFDPRSLTDYYYQQSNGRLALYGSVYPEVLVTPHSEEAYGADGVKLQLLTPVLLDVINRDPRVNLADYDEDDDGVIDYIVFVLRRVKGFAGSPEQRRAAGLNLLGYTSKTPEFGADPTRLKKVDAGRSGAYIRYNNAGNIFPDLNLLRLVAHEYGHNIWGGGHLQPTGGRNGVPENGSDYIGYLLMAGKGDRRGSLTLSAAERDIVGRGWIDCTLLRRDTTVHVTDLYSSSSRNCFKITYPVSGDASGTLYLSNRQRISPFDQMRSESCYGERSDHGLMTTGILVTRVDAAGRIATVAADNDLKISVRADEYAGDMFGPPGRTQLTPWTNPNIFGMSGYPTGFTLDSIGFPAIDSIRYAPDDTLVMVFDYDSDFRRQPTFRRDARIGQESAGVTITGPMAVADGSLLRVATQIVIDGSTTIRGGSALRVDEGVAVSVDTLVLARDSRLEVYGTLHVTAAIDNRGAKITMGIEGEIVTPVMTVQKEPVASKPELDLHVFPNPVRDHLTVQFAAQGSVPVQVAVYDVLGRIVAVLAEQPSSSSSETIVWNASGLAAGTYVVRRAGENGTTARAFVKVE